MHWLQSVLFVFPLAQVDDVIVTWKVLGVPRPPANCETEFDVARLKAKGKQVLACLQIPAMVREASKKPSRLRG